MGQYVPGFEPVTQSEPAATQYVPGFEPVTATPPLSDRLRDGVSLAYSGATAEPASSIADTINSALRTAREWAQPAANNLVRAPGEILHGERPFLTGLQAPAEYQTPPDSTAGRIAAEIVNPVPGDMTGGGAMAGVLALSPYGRLLRVLGAAGGAGAGSIASGKDIGEAAQDAGLYGATAGGVEAGSALLSKVVRSIPNNPLIGGKANILEQDAQRFATVMGEQVPALKVAAGQPATLELRRLAAGDGKAALGAMKESAVQAIEAMPSAGSIHRLWNQTHIGNTPLPVQGQNLLLREANDLLSEIGAVAFNPRLSPIERTFKGRDARELYGVVAQEIEQGLMGVDPSGKALALFRGAQSQYEKGMAYLNRLGQETSWDRWGRLHTPNVMQKIQEPRETNLLADKLGEAEHADLVTRFLRGAKPTIGEPAPTDDLASGRGGLFDALRAIIATPTGAGTWFQAPWRTPFPNAGSRYVGEAPYTVPTGVQTLLDLLGERAMDQARRGPVPIGPMP